MNGHKIINQEAMHFITITTVGWVDVFTRAEYKEIIVASLNYCINKKGLVVHAYVIMSNHLHLIVSVEKDYLLSNVIRDFKRHTSKSIVNTILTTQIESRSEWMLKLFQYYAKFNRTTNLYQLWQGGNKPIELASLKWINQKMAYIHNNPVKANIVDNAEHYNYSSARQYLGQEGKIDIVKIEPNNEIGNLRM